MPLHSTQPTSTPPVYQARGHLCYLLPRNTSQQIQTLRDQSALDKQTLLQSAALAAVQKSRTQHETANATHIQHCMHFETHMIVSMHKFLCSLLLGTPHTYLHSCACGHYNKGPFSTSCHSLHACMHACVHLRAVYTQSRSYMIADNQRVGQHQLLLYCARRNATL